MNKINADKTLAIRIPNPLFHKFKEKCDSNYKSMSEAIRDFIREYIKEEKCNK